MPSHGHGGAGREATAGEGQREGGVVIEPPGETWQGMVARRWGLSRLDEDAMEVRRELGLPTDRPVVMSGHQAVFWHPGILAKWIAAERIAAVVGGGQGWVVVDHDAEDPTGIDYPVQPRAGVVQRGTWRWARVSQGEIPANMVPPARLIEKAPREGVGAEYAAAMERARAALEGAAGAASLAMQVTRATAALIGGGGMPIVEASGLGRLRVFRALVERMRARPEACVEAYNAAVGRHRESGLRLLAADEVNDRWELPLWRLVADGPRGGVFAEDLVEGDSRGLAPKAILLTAFLRRYACDLFIHGLGGGVYDRVTDEWIAQWLGEGALAPTAVVSATLHLPLGVGIGAGEDDVARARWRVHHAMHNPIEGGDVERQREKQELVRRIGLQPRNSGARRKEFDVLQGFLREHRARQGAEIGALEAEVALAQERRVSREVAGARDWAFFLYPEEAIAGLRATIGGAIG